MFNTPINNRFKSGTFLSQIEITKTENQIKSHTKIDQDVVQNTKSYTSIEISLAVK